MMTDIALELFIRKTRWLLHRRFRSLKTHVDAYQDNRLFAVLQIKNGLTVDNPRMDQQRYVDINKKEEEKIPKFQFDGFNETTFLPMTE